LYTTFFKYWSYAYKIPAKHAGKILDMEGGDIHRITRFVKYVYVFKRDFPDKNIVRMSVNYVTHGEIWYLRKLLLNIPTYSLENLKYVYGTTYTTFHGAAVARGYVTDVTEALECFNESVRILTPAELRSLDSTRFHHNKYIQ
jgi:hypothetical protein